MTDPERIALFREIVGRMEAGRPIENALSHAPDDELSRWGFSALAAYRGSINAAATLHETLLPGWVWGFGQSLCGTSSLGTATVSKGEVAHEAEAESPAQAWLLAILRACIAEAEQP